MRVDHTFTCHRYTRRISCFKNLLRRGSTHVHNKAGLMDRHLIPMAPSRFLPRVLGEGG